MDLNLINITLEGILSSKVFAKTEISRKLLQYLTQATIEGKNIKEYTIASELFGKDSDIGVRANVHYLRKKLEEYYSSEGKNDKLKFVIPNGQYYVKFQKILYKDFKILSYFIKWRNKRNIINWILGLVIILTGVLVIKLNECR